MPLVTVTVLPLAASGVPVSSPPNNYSCSATYYENLTTIAIFFLVVTLVCCCKFYNIAVEAMRRFRAQTAASAPARPFANAAPGPVAVNVTVPKQGEQEALEREQNEDAGSTSAEEETAPMLPPDTPKSESTKAESKSSSGWVDVGDGGETRSVMTDLPSYPGPSGTAPPSPPPTSPVALRTPQGAEPKTTPNMNEVNSQLVGNVATHDPEPEGDVSGGAKGKGRDYFTQDEL